MEKAAQPYAVKLALRRMSAVFVKLYAVGYGAFSLRKGFERKSLAAAGVKDIDLSFWKPHGAFNKLYMLQIGREVAHFYAVHKVSRRLSVNTFSVGQHIRKGGKRRDKRGIIPPL